MKYLVTGGLGFIGSNIVKLLVKKGNNVDVIDNLHTGKRDNIKEVFDKVKFVKMDIRDKESLDRIDKDYDGVFHEAALTAVPESFEKPKEYYEVNVIGTKNIFEFAKKENIRVVFASSSSIYGNPKNISIKEDTVKKPINPYGQTKAEVENLATKFSKENLPIIGLRYFNVYGIGQTGSYAGVITKFLENIKNKKQFVINGNGEQIRDFIHVNDVAKINLVAMESRVKHGFFNVGTEIPTSINDLAELMIELSGHDQGIIHGPTLEGDVNFSQANMELTKTLLNWNHEINLRDGLKKLIQSYLSK
ncbi:NAD-dependent epimerase/dehydratase family protein [Candidatus Nitrosopumilus sp. SW]|uniref:NAD-dependent epimerase/dehydratase family protein n=1 Tax=Candidatus Nitrosopumilus sp. SW TaxID=2508726 RepID=UPI001150A8DE|nr:NAD-dependent epimerase/dehydratase family protein [Candidatus Nitrosopumilus sp. SW]QDI88805.1 NAD-dependent epimerase/dehydratase family protein [Candidatus Nitrosopumilus sp. SW]